MFGLFNCKGRKRSKRTLCFEALEHRSVPAGFIQGASGWVTPPSGPEADTDGHYARLEPVVTATHASYSAEAEGVANPPPPPPGQVRSTATAKYPSRTNPGTEYFLAVEGPGFVSLAGNAFVTGTNEGIAGGFPLFSRVTASAGGSATLGVGTIPIGIVANWGVSIDVRAGDPPALAARTDTQLIEIPAGERWIRIRDTTQVEAKSTVTATAGGPATAFAAGGWTATFVGLSDIAVLSAHLGTSTGLQFEYRIEGDPGPFEVGVFRSADAYFDASDVQIGGLHTVTPEITDSPQTQVLALQSEIPIDPARPYVFVVADPNQSILETDEDNNEAFFRKLALGVVTHGFVLRGAYQGWVDTAADLLDDQGYSGSIAFHWEEQSGRLARNQVVIAGQLMAERVREAAAFLANQPGDVVDVHFIGHSRGAVVISQALLNLEAAPGPRELELGYFKMTMLDPHPARNKGPLALGIFEVLSATGQSHVGSFSFDATPPGARAAAIGTLIFQFRAADPAIVIPANVDEAESYYQRLPWNATRGDDFILGINLWGELPEAILNPYSRPFEAIDVSPLVGGHIGVIEWYLGKLKTS